MPTTVATHPIVQPVQDQVDALTTTVGTVQATAGAATTAATAATTAAGTATTATNTALAGQVTQWVSARAVGATAVAAVNASGVAPLTDPAGRTGTQLVLVSLLAKTNTLPGASTTIALTATPSSGSATPVLSKTILLAALPAIGGVIDLLGVNGTTSAFYIPTGSTIKATASSGNFDFILGFALVAPAP